MNVLTYGTFDLLHYGHLQLLKRASELGDSLIVAVSTDEFNAEKNKQSAQPYWLRKLVVENLPYVDLAIPEHNWAQKIVDIKQFNIDILAIGSDWTGKFDDLPCKVVYLPRTDNISSTELRKILK